jgi:nitrous oxide reductase accessory protein NosL
MNLTRRALLGACLALTLVARPAAAQQRTPKPGPKDLCPVCGMLVSKYPNWVATVMYRDGHAHHFDGAKDMFKYLFDLARYAPGYRREDIAVIEVTEFYGLTRMDGRKAFFVIGSDVLGPMGHELVPLASREDAQDFLKDHKGTHILGFDEVTPAVIVPLDKDRPQPAK